MIGAPSEIKTEINLAGKAMNTHARIVPLESSDYLRFILKYELRSSVIMSQKSIKIAIPEDNISEFQIAVKSNILL
jgi:hypothetical protein